MHTWGRSVFKGLFNMAGKEFKTIDEQINILEVRGLNFPDKSVARSFLYRNNYYRISGYSLTLRNHDVFAAGVTFQNIIDIYEFDRSLRQILLKYIELIEVSFKSIYSYEFTRVCGPTGYLDINNFTDTKTYNEIMVKAEEQKRTRLPHEAYLKHYITELHEDIPLWAFVDLLTISNISRLYKISRADVKKTIAQKFGLDKKGDEILGRFMHHMTIIRNLCAHGSRLFNRLFEQKPWLNKGERALLIMLPDGTIDNAHLYGFILIMRRLLTSSEFAEMKKEILDLTQKYSFVNMRYYGFRADWKIKL
mgnify:CR=1 FL=1